MRRERFLWAVLAMVVGVFFADLRRPLVARAEDFSASKKSGIPGQPGIVGTGDVPDIQTAVFRNTLSSADTLTTAGILATTEFVLEGRQNVKVSARFSNSAATCKVRLVYVYKTDRAATSTDQTKNKIFGYSDERTLTAGTVQYEASYYPTVAGDEYFDGSGAVAIRILITSATSAGTVALWVGSK